MTAALTIEQAAAAPGQRPPPLPCGRHGMEPASVAERKWMLQEYALRVEADLAAQNETLGYLRHKISFYDELERRLTGERHDDGSHDGNDGTDALRTGLGTAEGS